MQALIDALPDEVTEDNAEEVAQALTDIDDAKESLTDDELAGLDLTRYDAAANALLALWGEAPADAVELLADSTEPDQDGEGYYLIDTPEKLRWFANEVKNNNPAINARLTASFTVDSTTQWTPIGTESKPFAGTFDGGGNTITGLTYTNKNEDYVGLFGYANGATIRNVTVKDATFTGNEFIGGVCGYIVGGAITGCTTSGGTVSGNYYIGGIAGYANNAMVQRCFNTSAVTGNNSAIGGIAGTAYQATVQDCGNTGAVIRTAATGNYGGIVGTASYAKAIQNCYNANSTIAYPISVTTPPENALSNCYYLVDSSGNPNFRLENTTPKTLAEFNSGEVAYLLQKPLDDAATESVPAPQVWGQTLTGTNPDPYPVLGGAKVYQTSPCPGYSNATATRDHNYVNGVCIYCDDCEQAKEVATNSYEISNQGQLYWFAKQVNSGRTTINAKLTADITINNKVLNDDGSLISDPSNLKSWTPIGRNAYSFKGEFDGNSHTIHGLYFNDTNTGYVGLFGFVGAGGTVKNVTLADSYVSGSWYVGGICGQNYGGTVEGCRNTGRVYGTRQYVGGVCGHNEGILQKSCNTGIVTGYEYVGGVCGFNVSNSGSQSTIQECYNTGSVSGTQRVGGVCGWNGSVSTLEKSYNTGTVSGEDIVGGVCGYNDRTVNGCYNIGGVSSTSGSSSVGGVCGKNEEGGTVSNCYYLDTIANAFGNGNGTNCESKTLAEFKNGEVAFLLQKRLGENAEQVWGQTLGKNASPVLAWQDDYQPVYEMGTGSNCTAPYCNTPGVLEHDYTTDGVCRRCGYVAEVTPSSDGYYEIYDEGQLYWFAKKVRDGNPGIKARLMEDITLNKGVLNTDGELNTGATFTPWTPIGTSSQPFTGTFDGNNKTISGLYINDPSKDYVGLFGCIGRKSIAVGTVKDVTLEDSYVCGNEKVGGVCGYNKGGIVTGCHNSGKVTGNDIQTGGVCGKNEGTLESSSNSGTVTGNNYYTGGVCGQNYGGTVNGCTNTGTVTGNNISTGGVCGENNNGGKVVGSHNEGNVTGTNQTGGVCGNNVGSSVTGCTNTGMVTGTNQCIGGVCGQNLSNGTVEGSHNEGNVTGTNENGQQIGGVCGYIESGTVNGCYNSGTVTGKYSFTGGVCGQNNGNVQKSYNTGNVSGTNSVGGVCGSCSFRGSATVQECYNTGTVSGTNYVGGVCGQNQPQGTVNGCYNTGDVSGTNFVGGVCGQNNGTVNGCYNTTDEGSGTGNVTGTNDCVGGVCGMNNGTLENSYNTGDVIGNSLVGGVCGQNLDSGTAKVCYNTGNVTGNSKFGGVYGESRNIVRDCYYLSDTSGTPSKGCTPRTAVDFQCGKVAFELQKALGQHSPQVWGQNIGIDKAPVLSSDKYTVYPTKLDSPCKGGFSNTADETLKHNYKNGKCFYCGQPEIAYTVTIPAAVTLGSTVNVKATDVTLPNDKQLKVTMSTDTGRFEVAQVDENNTVVDTCPYTVTKGEAEVNPGETVLTVNSSGTNYSVALRFNAPATTYSGTYTGTVNFTVNVG